MNKKICILTDSLSIGGAEKVAANMSISLSALGYDVHIVAMTDFIDYTFKGELYNFGIVKQRHNKVVAFLKFREYFKNHQFDCIIDHRVRDKFLKELMFSRFIFKNIKVIYCIHHYMLSYYFSFVNLPWLAKIPHVKSKVFVSVCNQINLQLQSKLNIKSLTIYNYVVLNCENIQKNFESKVSNNYIIGIGRLTKIKQFDKLIRSYNNSQLPEQQIKLVILGEGAERINLEKLVSKLQLGDNVVLLPFTNNPYTLIKNAKALVLSSKVEGFPMVLIEALNLNTPVVAFNCKTGPNEIIKHEVNGLLVEDQNEYELTQALNKVIDDSIYKKLKANTSFNLNNFSETTSVQKWVNILEDQM